MFIKTECKIIGLTLTCVFASCLQMPTASAQLLPEEVASGADKSSGPKFTFKMIPNPPGTEDVKYFTLRAINVKDEIVGSYSDTNGSHGFLYDCDTGTFTEIGPSGGQSIPMGLNDRGQVVGVSFPNDYRSDTLEGFLYSAGSYSTIPSHFAHGSGTDPFAINNSAQIVGLDYADLRSEFFFGFLKVGDTYTNIGAPGADAPTYPTGINDEGQIVGWYPEQTLVRVTPFCTIAGSTPSSTIC